jgi:carbon storage regulator
MLVLSRQRDESIMIGDDVEITIVDVRGDKVRLGITAPKQIPVHRREIYDAIQREKAEAKKAEQESEKPAESQPEKAAQEQSPKNPQEQPEKEPQEQR